jgi:hypothetical protein
MLCRGRHCDDEMGRIGRGEIVGGREMWVGKVIEGGRGRGGSEESGKAGGRGQVGHLEKSR